MKKLLTKRAAACALSLTLLTSGIAAGAANLSDSTLSSARQGTAPFAASGEMGRIGSLSELFGGMVRGGQSGLMPGGMGGMNGAGGQVVSTATSAGEIVAGATTNSAAALTADMVNAETITMTDENSTVKISESGTYIVTGSCADGSITVKKGTTGVVLVLKDLTLTSTSGAPLAINKASEVRVIVSGTVTLTDAEDPADEESSDAAVADAYDGAAIRVKADTSAYISGGGTLILNGTAKNGIKAGDNTALVIDGPTVKISATNDGINGNYDIALLSGNITVSAGDDAVHADRILTVGTESGGPTLTVEKSTEGLEGCVVNLAGGSVSVKSTDDAINATDSDGVYDLTPSINLTGAEVSLNCSADGLDSNGTVNLISGSLSVKSATTGGDGAIDCDGAVYIADDFDASGLTSTAMGGFGGMGGMLPGTNGTSVPGTNGGMTAPDGSSGFGGRTAPDAVTGATPDQQQGQIPQQGMLPGTQQGQTPQKGMMPGMQQGQMPQQGMLPGISGSDTQAPFGGMNNGRGMFGGPMNGGFGGMMPGMNGGAPALGTQQGRLPQSGMQQGQMSPFGGMQQVSPFSGQVQTEAFFAAR